MTSYLQSRFKRALKHPKEGFEFVQLKIKETLFWNYFFHSLPEPKVKSPVPHDPEIQKEIVEELKKESFEVMNYEIDLNDYKDYINKAEYPKFPDYYKGGKAYKFKEKSLEHYLAAKLLNLSEEDIYIDVASRISPTPEIYHKIFGCRTYRQDLIFQEGIQGNTIGGDASHMLVEEGFATKMALHCSFEHFEGNSDIGFIKEASRVLKKGGKLCILPLYLFNKYAIQTDPAALPKGGITFESDATLYCAKGWRYRHGRFYDIQHLVNRIRNNLINLKLTIYVIENEKDVDPTCHIKFISLYEKT